MKKFFKTLSVTALVLSLTLFFTGFAVNIGYSGKINLCADKKMNINSDTGQNENSGNIKVNAEKLMLFNLAPQKDIKVNTTERRKVIPCGTPFGIKMYSGGAVVVNLEKFMVNNKYYCPAEQCGIQKGDIIKSIDGKDVSCNEDLINTVLNSGGKTMKIDFIRNSDMKSANITPMATNETGDYKIGVWVRDSIAGIGTLTFYDSRTGGFASLGHAVCDGDTGKPIPLRNGIPVEAEFNSVTKGVRGSAGCLTGHFLNELNGNITSNTEKGVYGYLSECPIDGKEIEVAMAHEVEKGEVYILSTISGEKPDYYSAVIESIDYGSDRAVKNFVIKITDERLLNSTGGIVQGMSGSPIIQNGRLVGAVTHVFLNDPERGYGIFAENMLMELDESIDSKNQSAA